MEAIYSALVEFFTDPAWLIPLTLSFLIQVAGPHVIKGYLPPNWNGGRAFVIRLLSVSLGQMSFVSTRWAFVSKSGAPFDMAEFVLTGWIGVGLIILVPFIYDKLPESFRDRYSYTEQRKRRVKGVMTVDGQIEERPAEQESGEGEKTVIPAYDRTTYIGNDRSQDGKP